MIVAPPTKTEDKVEEKKTTEKAVISEAIPTGNVTAAPTPA